MLILLRTYFISFIGTLFLCLSPFAFATQPKIAIVLNSGEATVSLIDMATRKVTKTFYVGKEPHHLMMTPDEKTLLVANAVGDDIALLNPITGEITGDVDKNVEQRTVRINTREGASDVLNKLDSAMDKINATRATMGAVMNRLDHVINNLTNVSMNLSTSRSGIEDADYASSSTELAKTQIMQQAATAVLAQANTSQQTVLKLLGG